MHYETGIRAVLWVTDNCRHQSVTCTVAVVLRVNPICFRGSWSSRISGLPFLVTSCWVFKAETSPRAFPYGSFLGYIFCLENHKPPHQSSWSELGMRADCRGCWAVGLLSSSAGGWFFVHPLAPLNYLLSHVMCMRMCRFESAYIFFLAHDTN